MSPRCSAKTWKRPAVRRLLPRTPVVLTLLAQLALTMTAPGAIAREHEGAQTDWTRAAEQLPLEAQFGPLESIEPNDVQNELVVGRYPDPIIREEILRDYGPNGPR
jgi:hypothetical protein